jgi:hypothetical protein
MTIDNDDPMITRFYDELFNKASYHITAGKTHPPIVTMLLPTGAILATLAQGLSPDERAALFIATAACPQVCAAGLIMETWYAESTNNPAEDQQLLELVAQGRLSEYPGRKEAVVISIMTADRQAVMICPIDRATNSVHKAPLKWMSKDANESVTGRYIRTPPHAVH